jgi:hypothetical protein
MVYLSKKESILLAFCVSFLCFGFCAMGYIASKLEKPKNNIININNLLNEKVNLSLIDNNIDFDTENIMYISSVVIAQDDAILNNMGVKFVGFKNNNHLFYVEICDSVNKKCVKSDIIDRMEIRSKLKNFF